MNITVLSYAGAMVFGLTTASAPVLNVRQLAVTQRAGTSLRTAVFMDVKVQNSYFKAMLTILRRTNAIWVASGRCLGQTSWQPSSDMQPNTPSSSPTRS